jgi:glutamyl-tRNA reductase
MVVGEQQVQAQVKEALETALANKFAGQVLDFVFRKALSVGKRVRSETKIAEGKLSVASTAIEMANARMSLDGKNILIVGTGTMASLVAGYLSDFNRAEVHVAGRTPEHIEQFCARHGVSACALDEGLKRADVVFSATSSPQVLITYDLIEAIKRPIMLVDIAMPPDVDRAVATLPNVYYASIDDLRAVTQETLAARKDEIEKARCIIDEECERFSERVRQAHIERFIAPMTQFIEDIRRQEVDRAIAMLGNNNPAEVLATFSKALTKKLMHNFVTGVKSSPLTADELKRFTEIFMGNNNVSAHENEETEN